MDTLPLLDGMVTVIVKLAVPLLALTGPGTVQVSKAAAALGNVPHVAPLTAVAITPAGS